MSESSERSDVNFRIQERMLTEARQELRVERAKVEILQERIEKEETTTRGYQDLLNAERGEFVRELDEKNAKIEMLKKRVDSINGEYNDAYGRSPSRDPQYDDAHRKIQPQEHTDPWVRMRRRGIQKYDD